MSEATAREVAALWATGTISAIAILVAPLAALWIQRKAESNREKLTRMQDIFRSLWVNRMRPFYISRVDALNMIDVDFFGEQKVIDVLGGPSRPLLPQRPSRIEPTTD